MARRGPSLDSAVHAPTGFRADRVRRGKEAPDDRRSASRLITSLEDLLVRTLDRFADRIARSIVEAMSSTVEPRGLSAFEAAAYCGVGLTVFNRECDVGAFKIGERKVYDRRALDAWIDRLTGAALKAPEPEQHGARGLGAIKDAAETKRLKRQRNQTRSQ